MASEPSFKLGIIGGQPSGCEWKQVSEKEFLEAAIKEFGLKNKEEAKKLYVEAVQAAMSHGHHAAASEDLLSTLPISKWPQLPPQWFTTAAQLLDLVDKKIIITLRDDKVLIGVVRSFDQFGNVIVRETIERIFLVKQRIYADVPRGTYLIRGENIAFIGEIDLDKDDYVHPAYTKVSAQEVHPLMVEEQKEKAKKQKHRAEIFHMAGLEPEQSG